MGRVSSATGLLLRWIIATVIVVFIAISIYWQYQYEKDITYMRDHFDSFAGKPRARRTPVIWVMISMFRNDKEARKNEVTADVLLKGCKPLFIPGGSKSYIAHSFLTDAQQDSIIDAKGLRDVVDNGYKVKGGRKVRRD